MSRLTLLSGTAFALAIPLRPSQAQEPPPPATTQEVAPIDPTEQDVIFAGDEEDAIVVIGQRERGAVIGDIPPENQLSARDVRAYGATSIAELLGAIAPQTGSNRGRGGGGPVTLLNGKRISGFRELRDLPPEAILRVDIFPEEVALKYGYRADQRVVNIVLRPRFRSTAARVEGGAATEGGRLAGEGDVAKLMINDNGRTTISARVEGADALYESERDIRLVPLDTRPEATDPRSSRTLLPSRRLARVAGTVNRTIFDDVSATLSGQIEHSDSRSRFGIPTANLIVPATNPFAESVGVGPLLRAFDLGRPLTRDTDIDSGEAGLALNGDRGRWRWSVTGNAAIARNDTRTDRGPDVTDLQARLNANDPTLDPLADLDALVDPLSRARSRSTNRSAGLDGVANGPLVKLPAGNATATFRVGADTLDLDVTRSGALDVDRSLGRDRGAGSVSLDLPIAKRNGAWGSIGNLSLNGNAAVEQLSDFGTLTTLGAGLNWSPVERMSLIASWTREDGAPSINQLGDPLLETPDTPVFDFVTGETVLVTSLTGGNPLLDADTRDVFKLGGTWQPFKKVDLDLRADYVLSRINDPISSFPGPTPEIEAAFPERFVRNAAGTLIRVDFRPVNFDSARRETLRWGFNFTKPLKSRRPSQALIDQFRRARGGADGPPPGQGAAPPPDRPRGTGGGGRGGGGFGGGQGGRLQLSVYHTLELTDVVRIRPGLPELDYLHGDALNSGGGRPRHRLEAEGGWFNNGFGARLAANWQSGTTVDDGTSGDLKFKSLAKFDARLFANLGEQFELVAKYPWLRGSQVRLEVNNIFDAKQRVRDASGGTPVNYQADLLDPLGRTISISFRKLFLPQRFRARSRPSEITR